jgi:hypothetical protein
MRSIQRNVAVFAVLLLMLVQVPLTFATPDPDSFKVIGDGSTYVGGKGWYAGYVISGVSGTYTLKISVAGVHFPIADVKLIVLISDEAHDGGLESLSIEGTSITSFTEGKPSYYVPNGGPFQEDDYYGYNDAYVIGTLTKEQAEWPDKYFPVRVTVTFSETATEASKVAFLCYGINSAGNPVYTAFSEMTMFVIPEPMTIVSIAAMFVAFGTLKRLKTKGS